MTPEERKTLLFDTCSSKEELAAHIRVFLGIDLPDCIVDEESTSTPMDFVWCIYRLMLTDQGPHRHVVAASRNSAKTLTACILRFYSMLHMRRDGLHVSATLDQSQSANRYLDQFLRIPEVAPYVTISNTRMKELKGLPPNSFTDKPDCTLRIAVATISGVNSQRSSLLVVDELDLVPTTILSEIAFTGDPTLDSYRYNPIEIALSSRKTASGPIQERLDDAEKQNDGTIQAHKWSTVDWMQKCPEKVHKPKEPKITLWLNVETLAITKSDIQRQAMGSAESAQQREIQAYAGCDGCPAFIACQARAPRQTGKSPMLRSIEFVANVLEMVKAADKIIAQALNWRPERSAVVYKMFTRTKHFLKPILFWKWAFGYYFVPDGWTKEEVEKVIKDGDFEKMFAITPSKQQIYNQLAENGWHINYGVDWGYSPASATCLVGIYHKRLRKGGFLHVAASQRYANEDWARYIAANIWPLYPGDLMCPDMADPASPSYFGKLKIPCRSKKPARIETGVSQIRGLLWNPVSQRSNFAILDDGVEGQNHLLAEAMDKWTHKKTAVGFDYKKFEDNDFCDFGDPARYSLDPFIEEKKVDVSIGQRPIPEQIVAEGSLTDPENIKVIEQKSEMKQQFVDHMQSEHGLANPFATKPTEIVRDDRGAKAVTKKSGGIKFKI